MSPLSQILLTALSIILTNLISLYYYNKEKSKRAKIETAFKLSLSQNFNAFNQIVDLSVQIEDLGPFSKSIAECASGEVTKNFETYLHYFKAKLERHGLKYVRRHKKFDAAREALNKKLDEASKPEMKQPEENK